MMRPERPACRPALPDDVPALAALAQRVFDEHIASEYSPEGRTAFARYASAVAMGARSANHRLWLAEADAAPVAMLEVRDGTHLSMLFVESPWQRSGLGRALLLAAYGPEVEWPPLTVNSAPGSVGAYERMGFVAAGPPEEREGIRFVPMRRGR